MDQCRGLCLPGSIRKEPTPSYDEFFIDYLFFRNSQYIWPVVCVIHTYNRIYMYNHNEFWFLKYGLLIASDVVATNPLDCVCVWVIWELFVVLLESSRLCFLGFTITGTLSSRESWSGPTAAEWDWLLELLSCWAEAGGLGVAVGVIFGPCSCLSLRSLSRRSLSSAKNLSLSLRFGYVAARPDVEGIT